MEDLVKFQQKRIEAMQNAINSLKLRNSTLRNWVSELTTEEYPDAYKNVIRKELLKQEI
tara:strand:- start:77 stop:253 length:177 start_codon:yes stop_codon:yes gene_type:complete